MKKLDLVMATGFALSVCLVATAGAVLSPAQKCEKAKGKAAAKYGQCMITQRGKEIAGKIPEYVECATKLTDAFAKAEQKAIDAGSSCPTTGDTTAVLARVDGAFDENRALTKWFSNTRFVNNGDGTVMDTLTGLMWEKKTDDSSVHDKDNTYGWCATSNATNQPPYEGSVFTDFLAELNSCSSVDGSATTGGFAGHCDWRLPTTEELNGIRDCSFGSPCVNPVFGPTIAGPYWSMTSYSADSYGVWCVGFADSYYAACAASGTSYGGCGGSVGVDNYVRAVRGGGQ